MLFIGYDRIAIRDVFDDVGSKYVPPHVNISIGFGTFTSPTCVWPSLGWYTEWPDHGLTVSWDSHRRVTGEDSTLILGLALRLDRVPRPLYMISNYRS